MSHFSEIKVNFTDAQMLVDALVAVGVAREKIECHAEPQQVLDYRGQPTKYRMPNGDVGHVIIRRKHLPSGHNDIAFHLDREKGSTALICDYARDRSGYNDKWLGKVTQEYVAAQTKKHYEKLGKKVYRVNDVVTGRAHLFVKAS